LPLHVLAVAVVFWVAVVFSVAVAFLVAVVFLVVIPEGDLLLSCGCLFLPLPLSVVILERICFSSCGCLSLPLSVLAVLLSEAMDPAHAPALGPAPNDRSLMQQKSGPSGRLFISAF
jgi:hypothetical protein